MTTFHIPFYDFFAQEKKNSSSQVHLLHIALARSSKSVWSSATTTASASDSDGNDHGNLVISAVMPLDGWMADYRP